MIYLQTTHQLWQQSVQATYNPFPGYTTHEPIGVTTELGFTKKINLHISHKNYTEVEKPTNNLISLLQEAAQQATPTIVYKKKRRC